VAGEPYAELCAPDAAVVWLPPKPGDDPPVPSGARLIHGSADLQSLAPHLLEEPYEALEAPEAGDEEAFCEELGDVLLQEVFHARIAAERDDDTGFHDRRRGIRNCGQAGAAASARVRGRGRLRRRGGQAQLGRD